MNRTAEYIAELDNQMERAGRAKQLTRELVREARVLCEVSRQLRAETRALINRDCPAQPIVSVWATSVFLDCVEGMLVV
jgi:hypothetical protein